MKLRQSSSVIIALSAVALLMSSCGQRVVVKQKIGALTVKPVNLVETRKAWERIQEGTATPIERKAYNDAVDAVVLKIAGKSMPDSDDVEIKLRSFSQKINVELDPAKKGDLDLRNHDQLFVSDFTRIKKGLQGRTTTPGIGAPLALKVAPSDSDPFIAPEGLWRPATAILEFNGDPEVANLVIYDPLQRKDIEINGNTFNLESDFSVPLATGFAKRDRQLFHLPAMLHFEKFEKKLGLIRLTPFDPKKKPCILIHGLKSSPATWKNTLNQLLSDPVLREKYEFWNYGYPTGAPIPYSAMRLRQDIAKMREYRVQHGATDRDMIVVGHSMGGLLAKTLTQSSGDENWFRLFNKPANELDIPAEDRELLEDMLYFQPVEGVTRVVFISTPHRGSDMAQNPVGALTSTLIDVPQRLVRISASLSANSLRDLTPLGRIFAARPPTSIDTLRPDSPMLTLLDQMQLSPGVRYHSIIGINCAKDAPRQKWTDTLVPYTSASIEGVESEYIVPHCKHSAHTSDKGIAELQRILHLNIGQSAPPNVVRILNQKHVHPAGGDD